MHPQVSLGSGVLYARYGWFIVIVGCGGISSLLLALLAPLALAHVCARRTGGGCGARLRPLLATLEPLEGRRSREAEQAAAAEAWAEAVTADFRNSVDSLRIDTS